MNPRVLVPVGIAALAVLGVLWFFSAYERGPVKVWVGASGEARLRPFLAAERFAERMGLPAKELRSLPELEALPASGVLLMPNGRQALDAARISRILSWVSRGGHLIVEAEHRGIADPLLDDALRIQRIAGISPPKALAVALPGTERKLNVSFPDALALQAPRADRLRVGAPGGEKLVSFTHGKGVVSAATSLHFARNHLIGANDNAEFLWRLTGLTPAAEMQVYFQPQRLSLWRFLTEHAAGLLATTGVLLALWLWRIALRFGPVAPDRPAARRRLLDHLRASGRYHWTIGLRARLVGAARDAALRRIARSQPDFATASAAERTARLATIAGISPADAARLLHAAGRMRGADFIQVVSDAQRVHSALEKGNK